MEIVPQAIENARNNAALNGIENVEFFVGKAEEVLPEYYEKESRKAAGGKAILTEERKASVTGGAALSAEEKSTDMLHPDVIVVDPPRKGCDEKCLDTIVKMKPAKVVYVSCDSATQARDLKYLCENGYELQKVRPVDMFPQTVGIETVALLSRYE